MTISRGLQRSKKLERSRPVSSGQHVSKIFSERLFTDGPSSLMLPAEVKKIPPKVAPKPRKFVTDIMIAGDSSQQHHQQQQQQQYLSLDCLASVPGDYNDSIYSPNSRASSVSGHKSSSSSSSSSGHHSRSSTVSSSASAASLGSSSSSVSSSSIVSCSGGLFESKSCDSLLEPGDTDSDNTELGEDVTRQDNKNDTAAHQDNIAHIEIKDADSQAGVTDDQTEKTLSKPFSKLDVAGSGGKSSNLSKLSRCEVR